MKSLSERITEIQAEFGYDDVQLGVIAGVSKQSIGKRKNQGTTPKADPAIRIRQKLGISELWLIHGEGPKYIKPNFDPLTQKLIDAAAPLSPGDKDYFVKMIAEFVARKQGPQS